MDYKPDQLSQLIIEADALLLLLHRHREDTPTDAIIMLRKKLLLILGLIDGIEETELPAEEPQLAQQPQDPISEVETVAHIEAQKETASAEPENPEAEEEAAIAEAITSNEVPVEISEETPVQESIADTALLEESLDADLPAENQAAQIEHEPIAAPVSSAPKPISRKPASSIFNLNDKFRFRRELFGNSEVAYVECLNMLSAMNSLDEAKEYLFEDLAWTPENDDVKAFLELLQNYYN